jgi:hypothetical protein
LAVELPLVEPVETLLVEPVETNHLHQHVVGFDKLNRSMPCWLSLSKPCWLSLSKPCWLSLSKPTICINTLLVSTSSTNACFVGFDKLNRHIVLLVEPVETLLAAST